MGVAASKIPLMATNVAAANGASLPLIGKLLGHTQPQTTARYAHLADAAAHDLSVTVGAAIGTAMRKVAPV